ncbi:helix-turn-helix domain-containing protein [Aerococcus sp. JJEM-2022b]|nr:helix-turn-helix domain-containing protein [Aerococcus mictus]MCY3078559.1 helix-turn-helix domain-containing protein [Aerococcus mictus]
MRVTTGSRLKELMSERGLRQVDILNMSKPYQKELNISLNKSHLSQYVNDKSSPDQNKLYLLAKTLNVNEAWLMGFTNVPKERQKEKKIDEGNKKIIAIYDQLTPIQQQKVLHYAKQQLDEK